LYNDMTWLRELIEAAPRGPKPNHRHFTIHNHGNGRFVYTPDLTDASRDFATGAYDSHNVLPTEEGLCVVNAGSGSAIFEVRSPYVIVPIVGDMDTTSDDREASVVEIDADGTAWSISVDNGLTWTSLDVSDGKNSMDLTPYVSGRYGYLLKAKLQGNANEALLRSLKIVTWVQVAPASLPALEPGTNQMHFRTGDHYGLPTRVLEVRSQASQPGEFLKYLVQPPVDYDPQRRTSKIKGPITVRVMSPPGTEIAWFTASGQFRTHQRSSAAKTKNSIEYAVGEPREFQAIYRAAVPTYTDHWHYNAAAEITLDEPAREVFFRYTGDPAMNNFVVYAHCQEEQPTARANQPLALPPAAEITHVWRDGVATRRKTVTLRGPGSYEIDAGDDPVDVSLEIKLPSTRVP
jgi:hypothetical protein